MMVFRPGGRCRLGGSGSFPAARLGQCICEYSPSGCDPTFNLGVRIRMVINKASWEVNERSREPHGF